MVQIINGCDCEFKLLQIIMFKFHSTILLHIKFIHVLIRVNVDIVYTHLNQNSLTYFLSLKHYYSCRPDSFSIHSLLCFQNQPKCYQSFCCIYYHDLIQPMPILHQAIPSHSVQPQHYQQMDITP